ncbi:MAG: DUF2911 domain-containing protein [Cytophagia bacterium]|nr:DUF2911 domain-containing protein [Cytophagia bacterium]
MRRFLLFVGIGVVVIILLFVGIDTMNTRYQKSFSPEEAVEFEQGKLEIEVHYNRPYKKGRVIFGGLVPFGKVWRTGANEATTFSTNKDIMIEGKELKAGTYSLWTIPELETWTIIFNREHGQWGVNSEGEPNRDPQKDVLTIQVHAVQQQREFEQLTIEFSKMKEEAEMVLLWDKTLVAIPFQLKQ